MVRDRFPELLHQLEIHHRGKKPKPPPPLPNELTKLFDSITGFRNQIDSISNKIDDLEDVMQTILTSVGGSESFNQKRVSLVKTINQALNEFDKDFSAWSANHKDKESDPLLSKNSFNTIFWLNSEYLIQRFLETGRRYSSLLDSFETRSTRKMLNIIQNAECDLDSDRLMKYARNHDFGTIQELLSQDSFSARETLKQLEERHGILLQTQDQIKVMTQHFLDLRMLVLEQSHMLNRIEDRVDMAAQRCQDAGTHLGKARTNRKKARRKKFICIGVAMVVLFFLIISIILSFK